ncbi:NAD(P)-dependent oxidoreductase [Streptosporangium sp. NPDC006007]|uniref:NAD-dependent epimerase/dehydratase family protein n=1 Tax=Streptosporangium sp. NPDC006007 TaxID=3154575 RepID=UPI0033A4ADA3
MWNALIDHESTGQILTAWFERCPLDQGKGSLKNSHHPRSEGTSSRFRIFGSESARWIQEQGGTVGSFDPGRSEADRGSGRAVLVTGAAGLIGVSVVRCLLRDGFRVVAVDDGSAGTLGRLVEFNGNPQVAVRISDIRHRVALAGLVAAERPWAVVHLAARHFIPDCERFPGETLEVNVMGTQHLLDACAEHPPHRIVFASTADVYAANVLPHSEDDAVSPVGAYGVSKLLGERLLRDQAYRLDGCTITIGRLFNVYGPGDPHPHLLPEVLRQLRNGSVLRLGDLESARDFVYVEDAAEALIALLHIGEAGVFNVGTGTAVSGRELVQTVAAVIGREVEIERDHGRLRRRVRPNLCAAPDRLRELVPWWPHVSFGGGIRYTVEAEFDEVVTGGEYAGRVS